MSKNPKILIIGAGAAGISAACRLLQHGFSNLTVFEAENRLGGRIHSVKLGDGFADLGAQWCHGEEDNVVYSLVKDLNVLGTSWNTYQDNTFYESTGKVVNDVVAQKLFNIFTEVAYSENISDCESFGDYFIRSYNEKVKKAFGHNKEDLDTSSRLLEWFHKLILCYESARNWKEVSASNKYKTCEGDQLLHWKDRGYQLILDVLMHKYPDSRKTLPVQERIVFNKEVSRVIWRGTNAGVVVRCTDGSSDKYDHVILTVSLGVLKERHGGLFEPSLPLSKRNVIDCMSMGLTNKILLKFSKRWWPNETKGFSLVWTNEDKRKVLREFNLGPSKNGKSWLEDVFGFYVVDSHDDVLLGWVVGELAERIEEMSNETIGKGCLYLLNKFLGNTHEISSLETVTCSRWYTNKHFRGAYSFSSVKEDIIETAREDLSTPLIGDNGDPAVLFAGEATHSKYFSTVHGAIETGFREANRIINLCRTQTKFIGNMNGSFKSHL